MIRIERVVSTHPDIAALVTPLSASRIEGVFIFFRSHLAGAERLQMFLFFLDPLFAAGEERVVQRSVDRVSRSCIMRCLIKGHYFFNSKTHFIYKAGFAVSIYFIKPRNLAVRFTHFSRLSVKTMIRLKEYY
ncbi:hypothetical protein FHW89_003186 [Mucilaginibacter sp. SG564]|nr:hypothetical protein [Mucilaginibacter sp. SG564]